MQPPQRPSQRQPFVDVAEQDHRRSGGAGCDDLQDRVTGLIVPPRDTAALGDALRTLIDDAALRRTLGDNGRRRADALFSRDRTVDAFKELIETTVRAPEGLDRRLVHAEPT